MGELKTSTLQIKYDWEPLRRPDGVDFVYPARPADFIKKRDDRPGVYRWTFFAPNRNMSTPQKVLIGETESLLRRMTEYLKPTNSTERAWCDSFHKDVSEGWTIQLHLLFFEGFVVNGVTLDAGALHDPFCRKLIENWMVLIHPRGECGVLNKGRNLKLKQAEAYAKEAKRLLAKAQEIRCLPKSLK